MNVMIELTKAVAAYPVTAAFDHLAAWRTNPLGLIANVIGLTPAEASKLTDGLPEACFGAEPPAGLKLAEFERGMSRLAGALLERVLRPHARTDELGFVTLDAFCTAENLRYARLDAAREAAKEARRAVREAARRAARRTESCA